MSETDAETSRWTSLERWSPTLYLVAAALLVVHAGHHGLEAFTGFAYPLHHEAPFGAAGFVLGFAALLGLYPTFADRLPKLAGAGAVFATLGAVGWFVTGVAALVESAGADPPGWVGAFGLLMLLGVVLGYLSFGVASLRTDVFSRTTGAALLTPLLVMGVNIGIVAAGYGSLEGQFVVASGFALAHLAIAFTLRAERVPAGSAEPRPTGVHHD